MDRAAKKKLLTRNAAGTGRGAASIGIMLAAGLVLSGCSAVRIAAQSAEPAEATFADPETVMLRGIEETTIKAEYWDSKEQAVKVKKWTVRPPYWIVNEAAIKARQFDGGEKR